MHRSCENLKSIKLHIKVFKIKNQNYETGLRMTQIVHLRVFIGPILNFKERPANCFKINTIHKKCQLQINRPFFKLGIYIL